MVQLVLKLQGSELCKVHFTHFFPTYICNNLGEKKKKPADKACNLEILKKLSYMS